MKLTLTLFTVFLGLPLFSQVEDSLFLPNSPMNASYKELIVENPLQAQNIKFQDYTQTGIFATFEEGSLKRVQTPEKSSQYEFSAEGLFSPSKNLRLYGEFSYALKHEQQVGFTLNNQRTTDNELLSPHYLYVEKKADWENQNYSILGSIAYQKNKFSLGGSLFYKGANAFRKSDPRPEIQTADYGAELFSAVNLGPHQVSIKAGLGRGTDNNEVMAVNEYINSPSYPESYVRFSNGYGRVINFASYTDFLFEDLNRMLGAGYQWANEKHKTQINYTYRYSMESLYQKDANSQVYVDPDLVLMKYRTRSHELNGSYLTQLGKHNLLSTLKFKTLQGDNYNTQEQGQNFRLNSENISFHIQDQLENKKGLLWGVRLENDVHLLRARDLLGVTDKITDSWTVSLNGFHDLFRHEKAKLSLSAGLSHYFPLQTELSFVPVSSDPKFFDQVIQPDYHYDSLSKTGFNLGLDLLGKLKNQSKIRIFAKFASTFASSDGDFPITGTLTPRVLFTTGLSVYY